MVERYCAFYHIAGIFRETVLFILQQTGKKILHTNIYVCIGFDLRAILRTKI